MAVPTGIDRSAPVIALDEIDIDAPLDAVWQLHVDRQRVADLADRHHRRACVVDSPSGHSPSSVLPSQCGQGTPHGHACANTSLYTSAGFRGSWFTLAWLALTVSNAPSSKAEDQAERIIYRPQLGRLKSAS
jgi:hypothetical protein